MTSHPHDAPTTIPHEAAAHRSRAPFVFALVATSLVSLGVGTAIGRSGAAPREAAAAAAPSVDRQRVRLDPELARRVQVRSERVARQRVAPALNLAGTVDFDATRTAEVGGRISGRITRIFVRPGDNVTAGMPLAEIESAQLGEAMAQYFSAQARLIAAQQSLARERALAAQSLTTAQSLEAARASAQSLTAEARGAEARLVAMGLGPNEVRALQGEGGARRVTLRAPIAGEVLSRQGVVGQSIEPTSTILRIGDTSELWVQLDVFERDLARVHDGDGAEIASDTWPGRVFRGVVEHVDPVIDPGTRTARVRVEVDNPDGLLRPGQFVTARLRSAHAAAREMLTLPRAAVLQIEGHPAVFVVTGRDQYEPRPLELGEHDGDRVEVVRGLAEGDEVVVEGGFALKSELQR